MGWVHFAYIGLLVVLPFWLWKRRGLGAALLLTVAEFVLVWIVFHLMEAYALFPEILPEQPLQNPKQRASWQQGVSAIYIYMFLLMPAIGAFLGGAFMLLAALLSWVFGSMRKRGDAHTSSGKPIS